MIPEEKKEMTDSTNPKTEQRQNVNQTFNFYAPIGQQIAHVDKIEAHFDKDMTMHYDESDGTLSVDNGKENADFSDNGKSDCPADDLFRFIHPSLEDADAQAVHREVVKLCKYYGVQDICNYLEALVSERKIGMPTDNPGYEYKTFIKYYKRV